MIPRQRARAVPLATVEIWPVALALAASIEAKGVSVEDFPRGAGGNSRTIGSEIVT